jgi:polysaccharide pyruvyl transferase WcaK-like protein
MKIVITGPSTYGVDNMGDDAMLANLVQGIYREDPETEIIFLARHPNSDFSKIFRFQSEKNLDHDSNEEAVGRVFLGFNKGDSGENLKLIKKLIDDADLLIIGGNSIMEVSENTFLKGVSSYSTTLAILAMFCGTPYAIYGLNIVDPVKKALTQQHAKFLCENAISVTVREKQVLVYLKEMDIDLDNVKVCGDPAYGMVGDSVSSQVEEILAANNIILNQEKKVLSINYRVEYWRNNSEEYKILAERLASLIDRLVTRYNFQVLFIPNCTYTRGNKWEDDRVVNKLIKQKLKTSTDVFYIENKLNVFETYSLFSRIDIHISNRRHSNVFAAKHGKPFIPISISLATHISALLDTIDYSQYVIDINDKLSKSLEKIDGIILNAEEISAGLAQSSSKLEMEAKQHYPTILNQFRKRKV